MELGKEKLKVNGASSNSVIVWRCHLSEKGDAAEQVVVSCKAVSSGCQWEPGHHWYLCVGSRCWSPLEECPTAVCSHSSHVKPNLEEALLLLTLRHAAHLWKFFVCCLCHLCYRLTPVVMPVWWSFSIQNTFGQGLPNCLIGLLL